MWTLSTRTLQHLLPALNSKPIPLAHPINAAYTRCAYVPAYIPHANHMDPDHQQDVPPSPSSIARSEDETKVEAGRGSCTPENHFSVPESARSPVDTGARPTGTRRFFFGDASTLLHGDLPTTPITSTHPTPHAATWADNAHESVDFSESRPQDVVQQPARIITLEPEPEPALESVSGSSWFSCEARRLSSVVRFMHKRRFSRITIAPDPEPDIETETNTETGTELFSRAGGSRRCKPGSRCGVQRSSSRAGQGVRGLSVCWWTLYTLS